MPSWAKTTGAGDEVPNETGKVPWFERLHDYQAQTVDYWFGLFRTPANPAIVREIHSFLQYKAIGLVFESNRIEGAGEDSLLATQRIIEDQFPEVPYDYGAFKQAYLTRLANAVDKETPDFEAMTKFFVPAGGFDGLAELLDERGVDEESLRLTIKFGQHEREYGEVLDHYLAYYIALQHAQVIAHHYARFNLNRVFRVSQEFRYRNWELWTRFKAAHEGKRIRHPTYVSQKLVKSIHRNLMQDQELDDWGVKAGEYRIDMRHSGTWTVFTHPKNLTHAMATWVKRANITMKNEEEPYFLRVAKVINRFLRIHPFPDGNGRTARILTAMILQAGGIPFASTIRSDKRQRDDYRWALKNADRSRYEPLAALIGRSVVEDFAELDELLQTVGATPLLEVEVDTDAIRRQFQPLTKAEGRELRVRERSLQRTGE